MAVLATHPIHYQVQLFRQLGRVPGIDVTMLFCSRFGLTRQIDHTIGLAHKWYDESIVNDCKHKFITNSSRSPSSVFSNISIRALNEVTRSKYDALLVQGYAGVTEWIAIIAAKRQSLPVLFRGETTLHPSSRVRGCLRWSLMRTLTRLVDVFLPIGKRSQDFYLKYQVSPDRLVLSPYTVDNDYFFSQFKRFSGRKREIMGSLGITDNAPVVLYLSKMTPRKRPLDLLKAAEKLQVPATFVFVGDGPLGSEIESYISSRNLRNVFPVGFQSPGELSRFYAIADIFVLPSEFEPWGLVINEAMCFSLPIVTTHGVCSAADLVRDGRNGFLYEAGNIGALTDSLTCLIGNRQLRYEMGKHSLDIIRSWNLDASVDGIRCGISKAMAR